MSAKFRRLPQFVLLLCLAASLASCATVFTGTRDDILFKSEPAGATVYIDGEEVGETPVLLAVRRTTGQRWVEMEREGYETERFQLDKKFNWVSVLNLTGLLYWGIDLATGAIMRYADKTVTVPLVPALPAAAEEDKKEAPQP